MTDRRGATLSRWLLWSHGVLAAILLGAVAITLSGLIAMNAAIAEIKNRHMADFEEEEQVHRAAWAIETESRHGARACQNSTSSGPAIGARIQATSRELSRLVQRHAQQVNPAMLSAALAYQRYGDQVSVGDTCASLLDATLDRRRLLLDEQLTDSWITKLKELRLAITEKEQAAQRLGTLATLLGLGLGVLALVAAVVTARSVARSVTVPLARIAAHARTLGEGDFSPLPSMSGQPREVAQLAFELDRMRTRLAEVNQLKQAFLDSVSHDLRTPLGHIREALGLLLDGTAGPLQATQHRVAQLALRACEREIRLVSALLDLSRLRSGKPLPMAGQRIDDVIRSALDNVQESARRAGVQVEQLALDEVPALRIDAVLVETALINVIGNAIVATPRGGKVAVDRTCVRQGPNGERDAREWLRILVRDEGKGVDEAARGKIFELFFTTKTGAESAGSGLGLPLAREMLRAHRGDLTLLSPAAGASGSGAVFALWLPLDAGTLGDSPAQAAPSSASTDWSPA